MAYTTSPRCHPQGARITHIVATCHVAPIADHTATIYWAEHEDDAGDDIGTLTIEAGHKVGFLSGGGQVMRPFESLVWAESAGEPPEGLCIVVGFGR